jgi:hypothetical protein
MTSLDDRDEEAVRRFVESFAAALVDAGMPQMPALAFFEFLRDEVQSVVARWQARQAEHPPSRPT